METAKIVTPYPILSDYKVTPRVKKFIVMDNHVDPTFTLGKTP